MDYKKVKSFAETLESLLEKYAEDDSEASGLLESLKPLIHKAKNGEIHSPIEWRDIPGAYFFSEGTLRKYRDLEKSFAEFRFELTARKTRP